uniref:Cysteine-rich protein n=1 Tax=Spironucleus salmonicida TaxID=348837 RepID=V6LTT4_9EUKA|eukprot:EST44169.1 Hypothetical protein SS50377_16025 [Spironucleus salmonicida]
MEQVNVCRAIFILYFPRINNNVFLNARKLIVFMVSVQLMKYVNALKIQQILIAVHVFQNLTQSKMYVIRYLVPRMERIFIKRIIQLFALNAKLASNLLAINQCATKNAHNQIVLMETGFSAKAVFTLMDIKLLMVVKIMIVVSIQLNHVIIRNNVQMEHANVFSIIFQFKIRVFGVILQSMENVVRLELCVNMVGNTLIMTFFECRDDVNACKTTLFDNTCEGPQCSCAYPNQLYTGDCLEYCALTQLILYTHVPRTNIVYIAFETELVNLASILKKCPSGISVKDSCILGCLACEYIDRQFKCNPGVQFTKIHIAGSTLNTCSGCKPNYSGDRCQDCDTLSINKNGVCYLKCQKCNGD